MALQGMHIPVDLESTIAIYWALNFGTGIVIKPLVRPPKFDFWTGEEAKVPTRPKDETWYHVKGEHDIRTGLVFCDRLIELDVLLVQHEGAWKVAIVLPFHLSQLAPNNLGFLPVTVDLILHALYHNLVYDARMDGRLYSRGPLITGQQKVFQNEAMRMCRWSLQKVVDNPPILPITMVQDPAYVAPPPVLAVPNALPVAAPLALTETNDVVMEEKEEENAMSCDED